MQVHAMQGYLVISSTEGVAVFNLTHSMSSGPRLAVIERFSNITPSFGLKVRQLP